MGTTYSHKCDRTIVQNGYRTVYHELIKKNRSGLEMVLVLEHDGNEQNIKDLYQKIVVTKICKNTFQLCNFHDREMDQSVHSKEELIKILSECAVSDHLAFMVDYLKTREK